MDAQQAEKLFFKNHAAYRSIAHICGTPYLAYKLNQILINHIKKCLPDLKQSIHENISELETEILSYGKPISMDHDMNNNKGALLLHLISKFSENFSDSIDGANVNTMMMRKYKKSQNERKVNYDDLNLSQQARELFGGARILYIFRTEFQINLNKIKSFDGLSDQFILNSMRNASGIRSSLFIPEMCFENLVKMQIEKLRRPCMQCVDLVFAELKRIAAQSETTEIARFKQFRVALNDCVTSMLKRHLDPCRSFVNQTLDIELAYVNTNHPDFISMDDVFTERANHHSRNDMYKQIGSGNQSDDEEIHQYQNRRQQQHQSSSSRQPPSRPGQASSSSSSHANNPNSHPLNSDNKQARIKSAPSPPQNNQQGNQNGGGWFGFGKGGKNRNPNPNKADTNPFNESSQTSSTQNQSSSSAQKQPQQQQQQQMRQKRKRSQNSQYSNRRGSSNKASQSFNDGFSQQKLSNATQREQMELLVIKRFINSYFGIVKKNIADVVPKSIMFMLVNKSKQRLQQDLALALYKEDQFEKLLSEDPEISRKRKDAQDLLNILRKALSIINEVNDFRVESKSMF